ncbi:hypothetical protein T484DRAFT_1897639 [Baffinella frigidus]|nr:hypothetical protein T484DRAFT_1897639 [Cryptophyta sp. CCMP2293]
MSVGFLRRLSEALPLTEAAPKATLLELEQQRKARELRSKNVQWALEKSFERAKSAEDHKGMWSCATNMAVSYEKAGDHPSAESWHRKALYIARRYELPQKQAVTMGQLGGLETRAGDFERALAMHQEHLRLAKKCGDLQETGEAVGDPGRRKWSGARAVRHNLARENAHGPHHLSPTHHRCRRGGARVRSFAAEDGRHACDSGAAGAAALTSLKAHL